MPKTFRMSFWLNVATVYAAIVGIGLAVGVALAGKFPGRGNGGRGGDEPMPVAPYGGPSFGLEAVPPLGSEFDRQLLPAAFAEVALR